MNETFILKLENGDNYIRIITFPYQYWYHDDNGQKILCGFYENETCDICVDFVPRHRGWYIGVIDRKTSEYKILNIDEIIYQSIKNLNNNSIWGDPTKYDINICVDWKAGKNEWAILVPQPKTPLLEKEMTIINEAVLPEIADIKKLLAIK
jgi:hypothetical protein